MTVITIHMHKNDGLENYLQKIFFFFIFASGKLCLTCGSVGVGLHFWEAPRLFRRVHIYVSGKILHQEYNVKLKIGAV